VSPKTELYESNHDTAKRIGFTTSSEVLKGENKTICLAFVKSSLADRKFFYGNDIRFEQA
jgi:hypothetical protein